MEVSCLYSLVILPAAFTTISFRSYFKKPYFWIDSGYLEREIEKLFSFWTWWSSTFYNAGWRVFFQTSFIPPGQRHEWFLSWFLLVCTLFFLFWMRTVMFSLPGVTRLCIRHFFILSFSKAGPISCVPLNKLKWWFQNTIHGIVWNHRVWAFFKSRKTF